MFIYSYIIILSFVKNMHYDIIVASCIFFMGGIDSSWLLRFLYLLKALLLKCSDYWFYRIKFFIMNLGGWWSKNGLKLVRGVREWGSEFWCLHVKGKTGCRAVGFIEWGFGFDSRDFFWLVSLTSFAEPLSLLKVTVISPIHIIVWT